MWKWIGVIIGWFAVPPEPKTETVKPINHYPMTDRAPAKCARLKVVRSKRERAMRRAVRP